MIPLGVKKSFFLNKVHLLSVKLLRNKMLSLIHKGFNIQEDKILQSAHLCLRLLCKSILTEYSLVTIYSLICLSVFSFLHLYSNVQLCTKCAQGRSFLRLSTLRVSLRPKTEAPKGGGRWSSGAHHFEGLESWSPKWFSRILRDGAPGALKSMQWSPGALQFCHWERGAH